MLNKKIASEIAIGIILLLAIVVGGIFWWQNEDNSQQAVTSDQKIQESEKKYCTQEAKQCEDGSYVNRTGPNCEFTECPANSNQQIANPASNYCEQNGGESEIRTNSDGSQTGYCKFDDGSECEEWSYFRKECGGWDNFRKECENEKIAATTKEIVGWKIYKNTIDPGYGFEFKYPKNLKFEDDQEITGGGVYFFSSLNPYDELVLSSEMIIFSDDIYWIDPEQGYNENLMDFGNNTILNKTKKIRINGIDVHCYVEDYQIGNNLHVFYSIDQIKNMVFAFRPEFNNSGSKIISTLKFTD